MQPQQADMAWEADAKSLCLDPITARALATDWATLGALILEAATIATARHLAHEAHHLAHNGSVVEPPTAGTVHRG